MNLSKSKYTTYWQCPKMLWLDVNKHSEKAEPDMSTKMRLEAGTKVGKLAHQLFPNVVDATVTDANGNPDTSAMIARTQQMMANSSNSPKINPRSNSFNSPNSPLVIAEAAFSYNGCYCAVDLLVRTLDGWDIHEVKSSSFPEQDGSPTELKKYAPDIAYQKWVLTQCGVNVTGTHLVCLNAEYVRHGALDIQQLFVIIDMQNVGIKKPVDLIADEYLKVPANVAKAQKILSDSRTEPNEDLDRHCEKPYPCLFWDYCSRHLPSPSVFDVYGGSFTSKGDDRFYLDKKLEHYRAGRVSYDDLVDQPLGIIQRMQVERQTHINRKAILNFLSTLRYPLYFLDFETMQFAVPEYDNSKPYQQITFQYSLHVVKNPNTPCKKKGYGYLAPSDGSDPRRKLAENLCKKIPMGACTVVYNDTFEKSRLKEMAEIYPDLHDHLMSIHDGICDLLVPFREGHYYLPDMDGSFSIKSVLPALFPNDPDLDYHNLPGDVHNGGEAMTIFPLIQSMPKAEADAARKSLLEYCNLDTWAMVKVWDKLMHV